MPVLNLITSVFRQPGDSIRPDDVLNAPGWVRTQRFVIEARTGDELARERLGIGMPAANALIRAMLESRFKLQAHTEMREQQVFALTRVNDETVGPNIHPTSPECEATVRERAAEARRGTPPAPLSPPAPGQRVCWTARFGNGTASGMGVAAGMLAIVVSSAIRPTVVVDRTGLKGLYDFDLAWTPEASVRPTAGGSASLPDAPSIFTAVREQLGLKLEAERQQRRVVIIDHIELPTPD